ncbi:MAG TPA: MBL fold metallo-hydrolase [Chloroflexota bacterium]|nr:MBL fold metallo-hydrolase [Chloroflexota bacterium]
MRLTIIGSAAAEPNLGGSASCYLLETDAGRLVLECGHGAASKLLEHISVEEIGAILISHMHPDHFFDLVPLKYAVTFHDRPRIRLLLPPGGEEVLAGIASALGEAESFWTSAYDLETFDPQRRLELLNLNIAMAATHHFLPAWAMTFQESGGGDAIAYTSDTSLVDEVVEHVRGAELLLAEASLHRQTKPAAEQGHLTGGEAGELARRAGVGRLLLTHYPATVAREILADAHAEFRGPCELAQPGARYTV